MINIKKKLFQSILSGGISKLGSLIVTYFTFKYGISFLGPEKFGVILTIISMLTILTFADFGVSNNLISLISKLKANNNVIGVQRSINASYIIILIITIIFLILFFLIYRIVNWETILKIDYSADEQREKILILLLGIGTILSIPFLVVNKIQIGLNQSWMSDISVLSGQVLTLVILWFSLTTNQELLIVASSFVLAPLLAAIINNIVYFYFFEKKIRPDFKIFNKNDILNILKIAPLFFINQIVNTIGTSIDPLIISSNLGYYEVTNFSLLYKITLVLAFAQIFITPMWPILGNKLALDENLAKNYLLKLIAYSAFFGIISWIVIYNYAEYLIYLWTDNILVIDQKLLHGFGFYSIIINVGGSLIVYLNNEKKALEFLTKTYALATFIAIIIKYILINNTPELYVIIWITNITFAILFIIPSMFYIFKKG
jgi:O-antigen/teichoic acid export membrane protein